MANNGTRVVVVCVHDFSITVAGEPVLLFKKGQFYGGIRRPDYFIVHGDEFNFNGGNIYFMKYFRIFRRNKQVPASTESITQSKK